MGSQMSLPENFKIVNGTPIVTTNGAIDCDFVSLKNVHKAWIICELLQAASHATELAVDEATTVAGGSATAITATMPVWKNADISSTDTLVKAADADSIAATAGTTNQQLVIEVDPAKLSAGFDCIRATTDASSEATNFVSIIYILQMRYAQATPPSAIID